MSQSIAPGKWNPVKRIKAKFLAPFVGFAFVLIGAWLGNVLIINTLRAGKDPTLWGAMIVLVPFALGAAAIFPNIVVPIIYRVIDAADRDK